MHDEPKHPFNESATDKENKDGLKEKSYLSGIVTGPHPKKDSRILSLDDRSSSPQVKSLV